ncbi:MAG TPA: FtsX-like permease family protein [Thermoleophilaceae bacterium]|nr:FtsX-like permease family protein [Thermoleophilaceae bacterium]
MLRSFNSLAFRQLRTRPLRSALTSFGVVLGVGMVFGVLLLTATIRATFDEVIDSAWGKTDLIVMGQGNGTMPERTLDRIKQVDGVDEAAGMVGGMFTRLHADGSPVKGNTGQMLIAGYETRGYQPYDFRLVQGQRISSGREIMVEQNWARDRGYEVGDRVPVAGPTGRTQLPIVGIFKLTSSLNVGGLGYAAMPLDAARVLFDQPRGWMQISIVGHDRGNVAPLQRRVERLVGSGATVKTPAQVSDQLGQQLAGLNMVLYFFSGVALFVGGFLILNSFNMTVLQRMRELGMLRTLGASRRMATMSVLTEALVIGIVGTAFGLALGLLLASGLISLMRGMGMPVGTLHVSAGAAVTAAVMGILVTLLGAFWPARRAGRISPIRAVLGDAQVRRTASKRRLVVGLLLFLPGLLLGGSFWFGDGSESGGLAAFGGVAMTMAMFAGMATAAPFIILPVVRWLAVPIRRLFPAGGRLAADSLLSNPLRTAATAVALTIGLSVVVVNSSMSNSFVKTIQDQVDSAFARDFTLQAQGFTVEQGGGPGVPRSLSNRIARMPEAGTVAPMRAMPLDLPRLTSGSKQGIAIGVDPALEPKVDGTKFRGVSQAEAYRGLASGGVLLGSAYAKRSGLDRGDSLNLVGPAGRQRAEVLGTIDALGPMAGMEMWLSLNTMKRVYGDYPPAEVAIEASSPAARPILARKVSTLLDRSYPNLELQSAADAKQEISNEISRTFNMFNAIVVIAIVVSLLGVINTLAMSVLERTREIGVLRALGASRWQVRSTMLDESLMITLAGSLIGVAIGTLIGAVWLRGAGSVLPGMTFHFPTGVAIAIAIAAVFLGVLAAVLPARRAARLKVIAALTYE